ncbi:MAG: glucosidase, partial [Anaerolineae bacterium]|nr:glucosidase [Anaerolineae bacterium]
DNRYFDVMVEYAKVDTNDILVLVTVVNRGDRKAPLFLLPTLWFRNTWSWGYPAGPREDVEERPLLRQIDSTGNVKVAEVWHPAEGTYYLYAEHAAELLFTENNTNAQRLYGLPNETQYVKDAFHRYVVDGDRTSVNPGQEGTKCAATYYRALDPGEEVSIRLRISPKEYSRPFANFNTIFQQRWSETQEFYSTVQRPGLSEDSWGIQRQALAGLLWSKQFYYLDLPQWFIGDPVHPVQRKYARNDRWLHYSSHDIFSMPDKWEYPYPTWETAFQIVPMALMDAHYAKQQLRLLTRERSMHPNGQFPAYEWDFHDVNPPVHAWAALRIYQLEAEKKGQGDRQFLEEIFHKLMLNYAWWINRTDRSGNDVFSGGFLGLDNISLFDRTSPLPGGGYLEQADSIFWMGFYAIEMMKIALELARENPTYEELAARFYDHFLHIAEAMTNARGQLQYALWDEVDGFFYDALRQPDGSITQLRARSIAGLMPLLA